MGNSNITSISSSASILPIFKKEHFYSFWEGQWLRNIARLLRAMLWNPTCLPCHCLPELPSSNQEFPDRGSTTQTRWWRTYCAVTIMTSPLERHCRLSSFARKYVAPYQVERFDEGGFWIGRSWRGGCGGVYRCAGLVPASECQR